MNNNWKRTFTIIWSGQFFSILTSSLVNFAIIIWLSLQTGSAEILAFAAIAGMLPQTVIGPFTGALIDRWNRKRIMMLADTFIALCTLILALLFWFDKAELWHIFALLALRSVGSSFHMPAMQASVPLLAPSDQLTRIAGINQIIASVSQIAGPALGAMMITIWDIEYVLIFDVAGALIAVSSLFFVNIPNPEKTENSERHFLKEMKEGAMVVLRNKGLSLVFLYSIIILFFIIPISVLFPLMTLDYFNGTEFQAGVIEAVWSVGALAGGAIMGVKVYNVNRVGLINWTYILLGMAFMGSGILSPNGYIWFAILTCISGIAGAVYNSAFTGLVQNKIDPAALGRVFSTFYAVALIPSMIGLIGIGFIADTIGLNTSFIISGLVIILIGVIAFFTKPAMKLDKI
ncbi:MFS transporter [Lascolabacillus sp.]|jgi:DHA3 family macrolide efflux protein-like MFS transporter|uniref:MFS transporter n=1 Tax=Lascolabacillus sp. TaxID=1924068 RepID=UPI00258D41B8|nr:MFS transporter [Lascolabacillus sp.]MDD2607130.1 MFS transporter [Lascolabacillus sp.]